MMRSMARRIAQKSASRSSPAFPVNAERMADKVREPSPLVGYACAGVLITGVFAFYGGMSSFGRKDSREFAGDKAEQKRWGQVGLYTEKHLYDVNPSQKL